MSLAIPPNQTDSQSTRITKGGRKITYVTKVIQQPERARACGSGAKSSADRRPVDPPPIVELRVYEGEVIAPENDITFCYNANFFLFATLENARPMAQGRNSAGPASFPVLTGTPVAGMAYLDRPEQAGYFIFPDLSVRHEGQYRLSFALYEELKDRMDDDPDNVRTVTGVNTPLGAHVSHRLEVKSAPFTVFSAKKFPGLTESTALSRLVAEQGCRVRIRRDVRMRRRENKPSKDWDEYDEEKAYEHARRTATPDSYAQPISTPHGHPHDIERARSASNASNASFSVPPQRRPSIQDLAQPYQHGGYINQMQAPAQQNGYAASPYGAHQAQHHYPTQYAAQQPSMMQPPQTPYTTQHPAYQSQPAAVSNHHGYYMSHGQPYQQSSYEPVAPARHDEYQTSPVDYKRQGPPAQAQSPTYHPHSQIQGAYPVSSYARSLQPTSTPTDHTPPITPGGSHNLAPLKTIHPLVEKHEAISPSYNMTGPILASDPAHNGSSLSEHRTIPAAASGTKRSHASTFGIGHADQPLRHGARPASPNGQDLNGGPYDGSDGEDFVADKASMSYRRADGTQRSRHVPFAS